MMSQAPAYYPEMAVALAAAGTALIILLIRWIRENATKAPTDPWSEEVDLAVKAREATPVCVNCLQPQEGHRWFCPHCAYPSGEYVTMMPYLQIFATGEVLRRGVMGPPEPGFARKAFFVIFSASEYAIFAPVYWFWMLRKACGKPISHERRVPLQFEESI